MEHFNNLSKKAKKDATSRIITNKHVDLPIQVDAKEFYDDQINSQSLDSHENKNIVSIKLCNRPANLSVSNNLLRVSRPSSSILASEEKMLRKKHGKKSVISRDFEMINLT